MVLVATSDSKLFNGKNSLQIFALKKGDFSESFLKEEENEGKIFIPSSDDEESLEPEVIPRSHKDLNSS